MRHRRQDTKLGRSAAHREALLASLVCNFIDNRRIRTTLVKAKLARQLAERMVTLGKTGSLAARRRAISVLGRKECVAALFEQIAPSYADRKGGYTRIVRLGRRGSDGSEMVYLEWVNLAPVNRKRKKPAEEKAAESEPKESEKKEASK